MEKKSARESVRHGSYSHYLIAEIDHELVNYKPIGKGSVLSIEIDPLCLFDKRALNTLMDDLRLGVSCYLEKMGYKANFTILPPELFNEDEKRLNGIHQNANIFYKNPILEITLS